jgi:hypothetical protein
MWEFTLVVEIPWGNLPLSIKLPQGKLYLRKFVPGFQRRGYLPLRILDPEELLPYGHILGARVYSCALGTW